jgi:hypothetical protein
MADGRIAMFPFPPIPSIPDWIKNQLSDLGDFINPFTWFANAIRGVYSLLAWYYEYVIAHPPRFEDAKVSDYLYGNAVGLAGGIIGFITFVLMCLCIFWVKKFITLGYAVIIGVVVTAGAPIVFGLFDSMIQLGDVLSQAMMFTKPRSNHDHLLGFTIEKDANPLILIFAFLPTAITGCLSMLVVFIYEGLIILLKVIFMPALALRLIGPRFRAFSDWTFSAGVIAMVLGRPVMILCVEIGKWAGNSLLGGTTAGVVFFLNAMLLIGIILQYVMFKQAQNVVAKVSGNTVTRVLGNVKTEPKEPKPVDRAHAFEQYRNGFKHHQSHSTSKTRRAYQVSKNYVHYETKRKVADKLAKGAAAGALAATSGGTTAALTAVATAAKTASGHYERKRNSP